MHLKWILSHVRGYLELGMADEAAEELQLVPPEEAQRFEVTLLRALVLQEKGQWPQLAEVAGALAHDHPEDPSGWILWAYAVRRAVSIEAAEKILLEAATNHPKEATIQFNLGCYACQRGDLDRARNYVTSAIALDAHFREAAATDPDLADLRKSGACF